MGIQLWHSFVATSMMVALEVGLSPEVVSTVKDASLSLLFTLQVADVQHNQAS